MALFNWLFRRDDPENVTGQGGRNRPQMHTHPARVRGHAPDIPTGDFRFIALDVETACSDVASICQIGLACVSSDNQIQTFSTLVNPRMGFDPFNIQLHGIGPEQVTNAPAFDEILAHLLPLLSRHHLIQHSNFDKQAMNAACAWCGIDTPDFRWADSVRIARRA